MLATGQSGGSVAETSELPAAGENPAERATPTQAVDRIESLDVLRGFALLGILLLNILGFGLYSVGYFSPLIGLGENPALNIAVWGGVNVLFEGAMRALFSVLFGAGVVMFTTGLGSRSGAGKSGWLHYKRNFWLLAFGLFDGYVLLWNGDILIVYAICGALLYPLRNLSPRTLLILGAIVILLTSAMYGSMGYYMGQAQAASATIDAAPDAPHDPETLELDAVWQDFAGGFPMSEADQQAELAARRGDYGTVAAWNAELMNGNLLFVIPVILLWDALAMMLLGMALYRMGILSGLRSGRFYRRLMVGGFAVGLAVNGWEHLQAVRGGYDLLSTFSYLQATYHVGRTAMALGWMGLVLLICDAGLLTDLRGRLAAVGRTALTNYYLMHSLICLLLFTGVGLGLVGTLERWALYPIVFGIWALQLMLSPWWLARYAYGPVEWLWRTLTYGSRQRFLASP